MAKINDYYQKKQLMEKLASELEQLGKDQSLKSELEFKSKVRNLMKEYDKSPKDVLQILSAIDPSVSGGKADSTAGSRPKRPMKTYKNPHHLSSADYDGPGNVHGLGRSGIGVKQAFER